MYTSSTLRTELQLTTRRVAIAFEVIPAEPEVGLFSEGMEVLSVTAPGGGPELEYAELAWAEGVSAAQIERLVDDACRDHLRARNDRRHEPADTGALPWSAGYDADNDALAGVA